MADQEDDAERAPSLSESIAAAARQSGLGNLKPGETPNGRALIAAIGGVRGIVESVLPGIAFLVIYFVTGGLTPKGGNLTISVIVPVVLALVFVVARAGARSSMTSAIAGAVGLAFTAALTLVTGRASNNFVFGMVVNAIGFVVLLISLIVRWPLIGVIVGVLFGDASDWRQDAGKRRIMTISTWLWVGLFAIRLALEVPLYFANNVAALGVVRLITSVPLYAVFLWITWLLVRGAYAADKTAAPSTESD
jgi:hypothetical protein